MHAIQAGNDIVIAFPTLLLTRMLGNHTEINPGLAALLRAERTADPTPSQVAVRGWQSAHDLAGRDTPEIRALTDQIGAAIYQLSSADFGVEVSPENAHITAEMWGNVMDDRDFTMIHNHKVGVHWSGVYFVDAEAGQPEPERNGWLELIDPRPVQPVAGPAPFDRPFRHISVKPANGLMVIFPPWLMHQVYAYNGPGTERVSIAFNATVHFQPAPPPAA